MNMQCSGSSRSFAKEMRALRMRSVVASHQKLTTTECYHWSWSSYSYTRSCQRTQCWPFYSHWHLKQIGKMKKFDKWFPHKVTRNKNIVLKCCLLLFYATTMKHFLIRLWQATKSGFYTTTGNAQLSVVRPRNSSKTLPKVKLAPKKSHVTVCWSAAHLIHYSFLNLSAAIVTEKYAQQIDEMH